jgi:hypothetical protein
MITPIQAPSTPIVEIKRNSRKNQLLLVLVSCFRVTEIGARLEFP